MIREAKKQDYARIAEILVYSKRVTYRSVFHDDHYLFCDLNVIDVLHEIGHMKNNTYLVYDDGIIKGMLHYEMNQLQICELKELYVDPFFVGKAIGTQLLQAFIRGMQRHEIHQINTWVVENNHIACHFYEHAGFHFNGKKQYVEGTQKIEIQYEFYIT